MERPLAEHNAAKPARRLPTWLQGMLFPTLLLWIYSLSFFLCWVLGEFDNLAPFAELSASTAFHLIVTTWILSDARKRRLRWCHDFDSFLFFAWPVLLPIHLLRTRGLRAILTLLAFAAIWLVAGLAAFAISLLRTALTG